MLKKIITMMSILLITIGVGEAFIAQRITWWTLRLDELENKKQDIERKTNGGLDSRIFALLKKDAARCRETLEVLKKNTTVEGAPLTIEAIRAHIHQSLLPVYSLRFFEIITETAGTEHARNNARNVLLEAMKALFVENEKRAEIETRENMPAVTLTNEEADVLALELTVGSLMEQFDPLYRKLAESIEQDIVARGKKHGEMIEIPNLTSLIRQKATEKCLSLDEPLETSASLQKSGTWKTVNHALAHSESILDDVRRYLENAGAASKAEKARYYLRNLVSLDKIVFDAETEKAIRGVKETSKNKSGISGQESFSIPSTEKLLNAIDSRRRKILAGISGNEPKDFFEKAASSLNDTAAHQLRPFEKSIESCKKTECASPSEISEAAEKLSSLWDLSSAYIEKSIVFLEWASKSRSIEPKTIVENHRYFAERSSSYMNFLRSLVEKSISIAVFENPDVHLKFVVGIKKTPKVLSILQQINFPEKSRFHTFDANDINALKRQKSLLAETAQRTQRDINTALANYHTRMEEIARKRQGKDTKLEAGLAQYDMDQLITTLRDYASFYSTLTYAETALKRYAEAYQSIESPKEPFEENIRARAIQLGRLIPLIEDFDSGRLKRELSTKQFLKKEIRSLMSKVRSLGVFYRQNGLSAGSLFTTAESDRISEILDNQPGTEVADWTMTETNFEEIDRKAVKKLSVSSIKKDWKLDADGTFSSSEKTAVVLASEGIRFSLPGIWVEEAIDEYLFQRKVAKAYRTRDGSVSVYIAISTLREESALSEHSISWHNTVGSKIVKSGTGRAGDFEYYWVLARDGKNRIRESYALKSKPGTAVIISGQTPKDRYNFFRKKMDMIKDSFEKIAPPQKTQ